MDRRLTPKGARRRAHSRTGPSSLLPPGIEHWGVQPDMVTLSKALSGGYVPVGALLASRAVFDATFDSMEHSVVHGSTFGNGELAAAAALASLTVIEREGLVARAAELGDLLMSLTRPLVDRFEIVLGQKVLHFHQADFRP